MARLFLYIVAGLTGLGLLAAILLAIYWDEAQIFALGRMAPDIPYSDSVLPQAPDYDRHNNWAVRPSDEALQRLRPSGTAPFPKQPIDIFFIHPTTYIGKAYWNVPIDEPSTQVILERLLKSQATAFSASGRLFAPLYRQTSFGALVAANNDTKRALQIAYIDIERAFDHYLENNNEGRGFIIAGHSQGALLALMLLHNRIDGTPLADQLIAAYLPGWPLSLSEDIEPLTSLHACTAPTDIKCIASWQSFADGGNPDYLLKTYAHQSGLSGKPKAESEMLCTDPISWTINGASQASFHKGAVGPAVLGSLPAPIPKMLNTQCGDDGILYLSPPPAAPFTQFLLPGGNYHLYDIHLFYMDLRENVKIRIESWLSFKALDTATE